MNRVVGKKSLALHGGHTPELWPLVLMIHVAA